MISRVLEGTFTLILAYLVIANAGKFSVVIGSIGRVYAESVRVLQGR